MESSSRGWERPPTKNNLSIYNIIQLIAMFLVVYLEGKEIYDIVIKFQFQNFSFFNFIKLIINALVLIGFFLSGIGLLKDNMDFMKTGFILFFFGLIGEILISLYDRVKKGINYLSFMELLLYFVLTYVIYVQIPHI